MGKDLCNLLFKVEVNHFVGLIHDDETALTEDQVAALQAFNDSTGRAYNDLSALVNERALCVSTLTADQCHCGQRGAISQPLKLLVDLECQLSCRCQNKCTRSILKVCLRHS